MSDPSTGDGSMAAKKKAKKSKRKPSAAFMKPMKPSAALSAVVGSKPIPRTEVTKKLWAYIKRKGLQDKKNRRNINADDNLKTVFGGRKTVNMFEMTKLVNKHLK
jgi:chromatin remodeling complex protein RSC6